MVNPQWSMVNGQLMVVIMEKYIFNLHFISLTLTYYIKELILISAVTLLNFEP